MKRKSNYEHLKEIIDDYIKHMDRINNKRLELASREVDYTMQEVKVFNLLQHNIDILQKQIDQETVC